MNITNLKRRYPGVSPFTSEQKNIFFGRDNDITKLHKLISIRNQVLLYSKSGIGKTSLLNAGVLPKFEKNYTIIKIRLFAFDSNNISSPVQKIIELLKSFENNSNKLFLDEIIDASKYKKTLWYHFKKLQINGEKKFMLVFDQFEELFSYPEDMINQFKSEFQELTSTDIPLEIKQKIAEKEDIDDQIIDDLYQELQIKTVFAIRSDRLSLLNKLTDKIPDIQETFYELKPLDEVQTKSAITKPALSEENFKTKKFIFDTNAVTKIIAALSDNGKQDVESTQLQIVCQKIEDIAQQKSQQTLDNKNIAISENDLPEFKDIFLSFYDETINVFNNNKKQQKNIRIFIEDQLIRNNQRISLDEIICADYVSKEILQKLVNHHLLRAERNSTGGFSYELSHDTLIEPISVSRKQRIEREKAEIEQKKRIEELRIAHEKAEKERIERQKERKRQRTIITIVSIAALISIGFAIFGFWQMNKAIKNQKKTLELTIESYFKDAKVLKDAQNFKEAIKKYNYLGDTILNGDSAYLINEKILECEKLDSLKTIFNYNLSISDSVLSLATTDEMLMKADSLIKATKNLNYKYGRIELQAIEEKKKLKIDNKINLYIRSLEQLQKGTTTYELILDAALILDSNNVMLKKYK